MLLTEKGKPMTHVVAGFDTASLADMALQDLEVAGFHRLSSNAMPPPIQTSGLLRTGTLGAVPWSR